MSFLFDKRTKSAMRWVWVFFSIIIIMSMVLVFSGGSQGAFTAAPTPQPRAETQETTETMPLTPPDTGNTSTATVPTAVIETENGDNVTSPIIESSGGVEFETSI